MQFLSRLCSSFLRLPEFSSDIADSPQVPRFLMILAGIALMAISGLPVRAVQTPDLTQKSI